MHARCHHLLTPLLMIANDVAEETLGVNGNEKFWNGKWIINTVENKWGG